MRRGFPFVAILRGLIAAAALVSAGVAGAHEVRPAILDITAVDGGYLISWRQPTVEGRALDVTPTVSGGWLDAAPTRTARAEGRLERVWEVAAAPQALRGRTVSVAGLEATITDVMVRLRDAEGGETTHRLTAEAPAFTVGEAAKGLPVPAYLTLGIQHILSGWDHLLFVLALVMLVGPGLRLAGTVTAFTVGHSVTLALAATGLVRPPAAFVESAIALSIVLVCVEVVHRWHGRAGFSARFPWIIATAFGLLHGLGFAGALVEVGLPPSAVISALLLFNAGVEVGQLAFVGVVLSLRALVAHLLGQLASRARWGVAYAAGAVASMWAIERTLAAFRG